MFLTFQQTPLKKLPDTGALQNIREARKWADRHFAFRHLTLASAFRTGSGLFGSASSPLHPFTLLRTLVIVMHTHNSAPALIRHIIYTHCYMPLRCEISARFAPAASKHNAASEKIAHNRNDIFLRDFFNFSEQFCSKNPRRFLNYNFFSKIANPQKIKRKHEWIVYIAPKWIFYVNLNQRHVSTIFAIVFVKHPSMLFRIFVSSTLVLYSADIVVSRIFDKIIK